MPTEKRKAFAPGALGKFSPLPVDYTKVVRDVFATNFDAGLKAYDKLHDTQSSFEISGGIYVDEVVLCVSLHSTLNGKEQLAATSVWSSSDFDPTASSPTAQDLLAACVDAAGAIYSQLLDPKNKAALEALGDESLSALSDVPFEWTPMNVERFRVYLRVDKANPKLDQMADEWLDQNDPERKEREAREHEETEKLFVTGPKKGETRH